MGKTVVLRTFRAFRASLLKKYAKHIERIRKARMKKKIDFRRRKRGFVAILANRRTKPKRKESVVLPGSSPWGTDSRSPIVEPVLDTPANSNSSESNPCTCSPSQRRSSGSSSPVAGPSTSAAAETSRHSSYGSFGSCLQFPDPSPQFPATATLLNKSKQGFHDLLARYNMIDVVESLRRDPAQFGLFPIEPQAGPSRKQWNRDGRSSSSSVFDMKELKEVAKLGTKEIVTNFKEEANDGDPDENSKAEEMECDLQEPMTPETPAFSPLSVKSCDGLEGGEEEPNFPGKEEGAKEGPAEEKDGKWDLRKVKEEPKEQVDAKLNGKCGESSSGGKKGGGCGGEDDNINQFGGARLIPVGVIRMEFKKCVKKEGSTGKIGKAKTGDSKKGIRRKMRGTFEVTGAYSGTVAVPRDADLTDPLDLTTRRIGESSILQMNPNAFVVGQDHFVMKAVARAVAEGRLPTGNRKLTGVTHKSPVLGELVVTSSADDEEGMNANEQKYETAGDASLDVMDGAVKVEKDE